MSQNENKKVDLFTALAAMTSVLPSLTTTENKGKHKAHSKKTKKGASHIVGPAFKPKFLIEIDGKFVTPAMYRKLHLGAKKKN